MNCSFFLSGHWDIYKCHVNKLVETYNELDFYGKKSNLKSTISHRSENLKRKVVNKDLLLLSHYTWKRPPLSGQPSSSASRRTTSLWTTSGSPSRYFPVFLVATCTLQGKLDLCKRNCAVYLFSSSRIGRPIVWIFKSLTETLKRLGHQMDWATVDMYGEVLA